MRRQRGDMVLQALLLIHGELKPVYVTDFSMFLQTRPGHLCHCYFDLSLKKKSQSVVSKWRRGKLPHSFNVNTIFFIPYPLLKTSALHIPYGSLWKSLCIPQNLTFGQYNSQGFTVGLCFAPEWELHFSYTVLGSALFFVFVFLSWI